MESKQKKRNFLKMSASAGALFLIFMLFSCTHEKNEQRLNMAAGHGLQFEALAQSWDEAIPLGNGELGALVWQKSGHLRFSLDRSDLWDLRPIESFNKPEFSYRWVAEQVIKGDYTPVQQLFDVPYNQLPGPSKIPGAALEFDVASLGTVNNVQLKLDEAICRVEWDSGAVLETFVQADFPSGWFFFKNVPEGFGPNLIPPEYQKQDKSKQENALTGQDLQRLGYTQGETIKDRNKMRYWQQGWGGFEYEAAVAWKESGKNGVQGCWNISSTFSEKKSGKRAEQVVDKSLKKGFKNSLESHRMWWNNFWAKSAVSLPDSILENQWYMEQYKFGSAARSDTPPISLQAVWTADHGKLPPWKGDFHHDLNTQLSYWPAYSGNHLDLEEGFLNWLWKNRETFKRYTRNYFGTDGLNVPGVTTLTGEPMGGWIQYSFGPTVSAWLGQHFYLHWIYSKDPIFLQERAYPWIKDVAIYLDEISIKNEKGMRKLPISSSPEINDNRIDAWFSETTNFDLALIRFTFEKAAEMATELGKQDEAEKWSQILGEWPQLALAGENNGLAFAPGYPYEESHRHFSHLLGWHPLGIIDWSSGGKEQNIIDATLKDLEKFGSDLWVGYSFSWLGNLYARAFEGDKAAEILRVFAENFCLPNSFHVNGEQHNRGYSRFKYRPFTLEGNFAFASGIQEMLLQSHSGVVRIFPAIPASWKDVSFYGLRAVGAFVIDAEMISGKIVGIKILAEKGETIQLENPFDQGEFEITGGEILEKGEILKIKISPGETAFLYNL
jgi:alpha-L-fucosidase 2